MKQDLNKTTISCPLFEKHKVVLLSKKNGISNSVRPIEKSILAEDISNTADKMLNCEKFDKLSLDCNVCNSIANNQKKKAETHFNVRKTA